MTILIAVRTGSAAILAADSKLTTQSLAGKNPDGTPRFLPQTYDHAVKITADASNTCIAAFAGHGAIGTQTATDYFSRVDAKLHLDAPTQDARLQTIANEMALVRANFAASLSIQPTQIPETIGLLTAAPLNGPAPRVWRLRLVADTAEVTEILTGAGAWLDGSADAAFSLLYGRSNVFSEGLRAHLKLEEEVMNEAMQAQSHVLPISQINFWTMPVQDALDFAVFCASIQIEMDRFLPGFGNCGGPIDLMTLEMAPKPHIHTFPGKSLHHPTGGGR